MSRVAGIKFIRILRERLGKELALHNDQAIKSINIYASIDSVAEVTIEYYPAPAASNNSQEAESGQLIPEPSRPAPPTETISSVGR